MPAENPNLPEHQSDFVQQCVESGRYHDSDDVIRAGLRLLEQQEAQNKARLETLQHVARDAFEKLDKGQYTTFTPDTIDDLFRDIDRTLQSSRSA